MVGRTMVDGAMVGKAMVGGAMDEKNGGFAGWLEERVLIGVGWLKGMEKSSGQWTVDSGR